MTAPPPYDPAMDQYIDDALTALGGDKDAETDFILTAKTGSAYGQATTPTIELTCRIAGCEWGFTVGQMELWEFVADARKHYVDVHKLTPGPGNAG